MKLHLVDINPKLVAAWMRSFFGLSGVSINERNILEVATDTIVSPANGYGFMDGGIDGLYTDFFGLQPQEQLQEVIAGRTEGFLPVGAAVMVKTGHQRIPRMIAAPTMITPGPVDAANCFQAMIAILECAWQHRNVIRDIYCPGLATGTGRVEEESAAEEMANAYRKWCKVRLSL